MITRRRQRISAVIDYPSPAAHLGGRLQIFSKWPVVEKFLRRGVCLQIFSKWPFVARSPRRRPPGVPAGTAISAAPQRRARRRYTVTLALSQARCSHNTTNARTATSRAAQMRMLQTSCRVAGSFFAMAIAVASDATSQRAAVAQRLTNFGRSLRIYRI